MADAIRLLDHHHGLAGDQPFFLQVSHTMAHFPISPPRNHVARFADLAFNRQELDHAVRTKLDTCSDIVRDPEHGLRRYLAELYGFDMLVGRVLQRVDDLGLASSTIVIIVSDHGAAPVTNSRRNPSQDQCDMMGSAGPFVGGKHDLTEGGVRVPLIVRFPGRVPAGAVNARSTMALVDFLPTIANLTGVTPAAVPTNIDGIDRSDVLLGSEPWFRPGPLLWFQSNELSVLQGQYKLHIDIRDDPPLDQLFNVDEDPRQRNNLWSTPAFTGAWRAWCLTDGACLLTPRATALGCCRI